MEISFGTDGWRGVISDQVTFSNLRLLAGALATYLINHGCCRQGVVIGYDTRFLSSEYAQVVTDVLLDAGVSVFLASESAPSPAVSYNVRSLHAAAGLVITASHNPAVYNGVKIKGPYGGPASPEMLAEITAALADGRLPKAQSKGELHQFHPAATYLPKVLTLVDGGSLGRSGMRLVVDSMYGSGQGYLASVLRRCCIPCCEIRSGYNPGFDGISPEPLAKNLNPLAQAVRDFHADLGLALDGDGDRLGVVNGDGVYVDAQHVLAMVARHLVEQRHWPGNLGKTVVTTMMLDRLAALYNRRLHTTPVGFEHLTGLFLEGEMLLAGEEGGGMAIRNHIPERDGIAAGLLLLDALAVRGVSVQELGTELHDLLGPHYYRRLDLRLTPELEQCYRQWLLHPPEKLGRFKVTGVDLSGGIKCWLNKHGWAGLRLSGTEPLLRLYAESNSQRKTDEILRGARKLLFP